MTSSDLSTVCRFPPPRPLRLLPRNKDRHIDMYIVHHTTYLLLWRYLVTNPHRFVLSTFSQFVLSWFLMFVACESNRAASAVVVSSSPNVDSDGVMLCLRKSVSFAMLVTIFLIPKVHALIPNFSLLSSPDVFHHFTFHDFLPSTLYCTCISTSVVVVVFVVVFFIR